MTNLGPGHRSLEAGSKQGCLAKGVSNPNIDVLLPIVDLLVA